MLATMVIVRPTIIVMTIPETVPRVAVLHRLLSQVQYIIDVPLALSVVHDVPGVASAQPRDIPFVPPATKL